MAKLIGALTTADFEFCYKCGLFFTDTDVTAVQLGNSDPEMFNENYTTWLKIVETVNTNKISLVDYKIKAVPDAITEDGPNKITTYDDIKSVKISKLKDTGSQDQSDDQYTIDISTGILNNTGYLIPAASLDEAVQLIKKTSLASKLDITNTSDD
jgi:hypothetical protein